MALLRELDLGFHIVRRGFVPGAGHDCGCRAECFSGCVCYLFHPGAQYCRVFSESQECAGFLLVCSFYINICATSFNRFGGWIRSVRYLGGFQKAEESFGYIG